MQHIFPTHISIDELKTTLYSVNLLICCVCSFLNVVFTLVRLCKPNFVQFYIYSFTLSISF